MNLEFIWIEDYGVIKHQGLNFNANRKYFFDEKNGIFFII